MADGCRARLQCATCNVQTQTLGTPLKHPSRRRGGTHRPRTRSSAPTARPAGRPRKGSAATAAEGSPSSARSAMPPGQPSRNSVATAARAGTQNLEWGLSNTHRRRSPVSRRRLWMETGAAAGLPTGEFLPLACCAVATCLAVCVCVCVCVCVLCCPSRGQMRAKRSTRP